MEKSSVFSKMKCGTKRNFDVAFLSGESEADDATKNPKEREKYDEKQNLIANSKWKSMAFCMNLSSNSSHYKNFWT